MLERGIFYGDSHLPIPRRRGPSAPTFSRFPPSVLTAPLKGFALEFLTVVGHKNWNDSPTRMSKSVTI